MSLISSIFTLFAEALATWAIVAVIWFLLNLIANWKILSKAGKGGWQSLIPIWNNIARYGVSWSKFAGFLVTVVFPILLYCFGNKTDGPEWLQVAVAVVAFVTLLCVVIEKFKLAKVYGHGFFFGLGLLILEPLFILILAFGKSEYVGKN